MLTIFRQYSNSMRKSEFSRELETLINFLNERRLTSATNSNSLEMGEYTVATGPSCLIAELRRVFEQQPLDAWDFENLELRPRYFKCKPAELARRQ